MALLAPELRADSNIAVGIAQDENSFTLTNGILAVRVSKRSGDLVSLRFKGLEMLDRVSERGSAYWSHDVSRGERQSHITIDPAANGGARGEVSIKGISGGRPMGSGPGGSVVADIEIRYALGREDSAVYTYCIFSHPANYPATGVGEARFCLKLNDSIFDWMTVDSRRNMEMITTYDWNHAMQMNMKEARRMNTGADLGQVEHKYDYSANQFDVRAWGWSSTAQHVGVWLVNPSVEYLSGGPTKFELSAHRDATFNTNSLTAPAPPTLLNYWRGSHYGGSVCAIAATDSWTKVIGPFLIYCDSEPSRDAMWKDALARAAEEAKVWPYDWVSGVDYPHKNQRATVVGKIALADPETPNARLERLLVGLSAPDYPIPRRTREGGGGGSGGSGPPWVTWQNDAKHYEFWVRGGSSGDFSIPNVRPGIYTLHAIANGVLGEFTVTNVTVEPGQVLRLPPLTWKPVRYGKQLWDIGIPNRDASEFFKGDDYYHWGWYLEYPKLFPNDVHYVIGQSDFHKDWFFEQVPHNENPANTTGQGRGRSTTWSVEFDLPQTPHGKATLRLALCGIGTRSITVGANDHPLGSVTGLVYNATINRDGIGGAWTEKDLAFNAAALKAGHNILTLTIPAGSLTSGIIYDYLRLELDESAPPPAPVAQE
ncbi:MAG TPA: polysaccharide lyase family protein [Candidatus Saccharimonadales bacterium]|nr:polysaccharide lyase family protein [Candidatus Saccharimonadales bacterium]